MLSDKKNLIIPILNNKKQYFCVYYFKIFARPINNVKLHIVKKVKNTNTKN
jgi:hypothetical protein